MVPSTPHGATCVPVEQSRRTERLKMRRRCGCGLRHHIGDVSTAPMSIYIRITQAAASSVERRA
jgi:hypothetical protein